MSSPSVLRSQLDPTAAEWARQQLTVRDLTLLRSRPWADVFRADTTEGVWWLKVNKAGTTYEPRLVAHLDRLGSTLVPRCRVHPDQPWSLIADAGDALADSSVDRVAEVEVWSAVLAGYAALQQASAQVHLPGALGLPDFSPGRLVEQFDAAWADQQWFSDQVGYPQLRPRVVETRARLVAAAGQLTGGRPSAVQHDDLHGGNVFLHRGRVRVIDWGDAVWAHPFGTLLVTRRSLAARWRVDPDDPVLRRVQEAYLEPWRTAGESAAALAAEVDLVLRTAPLTRVAGWIRALGTLADAQQLGDADAPAFWLVQLADALAGADKVTP